MTPLEIAANAAIALSIGLAARNHMYTWWTGIIGCALFVAVFYQAQLYADATLQVFFIATSAIGWWQWAHPTSGDPSAVRPISRAQPHTLLWMLLGALSVGALYGALLHHFTDAYLPYVDAAVLTLSVVAQFLLMQRKVQTWFFWLAVNTLCVPLFLSRGLYLTAALYAVYWCNAWYGWWRWQAACRSTPADPQAASNPPKGLA